MSRNTEEMAEFIPEEFRKAGSVLEGIAGLLDKCEDGVDFDVVNGLQATLEIVAERLRNAENEAERYFKEARKTL